jgi:FkbM family methyltransferase
MSRKVHVFDNGVSVYDDHLLSVQRERYRKRNVHEAEEEDVFVALVRNLPADGCYVNIGCAIGYYPILARRLAPQLAIHAVEPLARHRDYFSENARLNGFSPFGFAVHVEAIAARIGTAPFLDDSYGSTLVREEPRPPVSSRSILGGILAALGLGPRAVTRTPGRVVPTTTLDALVERIGRPVHLVQMDVQGFEMDVLRGGQQSLRAGRVETFLIGTHGAAIHRECTSELQRHGYTIEFSEPETKDQPDGILVASKGVRRLAR